MLTVVGLISVVYSMTSKTTAASMIPIIFTSGLFVSSFISNYIYQYFTQKQVLWIFQGLKLANTGDVLTVVGLISVVYSMTSKTTAASMIPIIF
ncbi:hypothetical protein, partial [Streptococcus pneumoniae]|uniref:hypothetical protein n=1 Tax=Streptococcus pneumoniae TaxID=1313 RepID=UPI001CB7783B